MEAVNIWYQDRRGEDEKKDMARQEVRAPQRQLDDLHDELARGLRHRVAAKAPSVPLSGPPRPIRLVVLELAGEEDRDENLVHCPLDENNTNEAEHRVCDVPQLQEPLYSRPISPPGAESVSREVRTRNSKNAIMPMAPRAWAMNAITDPNLGYLVSRSGPRNSENMKRMRRIAASQTMGPSEMIAIRMSGLAGCLPSRSGKDLTNM